MYRFSLLGQKVNSKHLVVLYFLCKKQILNHTEQFTIVIWFEAQGKIKIYNNISYFIYRLEKYLILTDFDIS